MANLAEKKPTTSPVAEDMAHQKGTIPGTKRQGEPEDKRNEKGQVVVGAPAQEEVIPQSLPDAPMPWIQEGQEFLVKHGWVCVGKNERGVSIWRDPLGKRHRPYDDKDPEQNHFYELPDKEGKATRFQQKVTPITTWEYAMDQAMLIQHQRIKGKADMEQHEKEVAAHNEKLQREARERAEQKRMQRDAAGMRR